MILNPKKNSIAYRCPSCGDMIHGFVGQLHADMLRIKCPCGSSAMEIHFRDDKKVRFSIPCVFCKSSHTSVVSGTIVFDRDKFLLSCPYANMDIAFLGSEENVNAEAQRAEEELSRLLTTADGAVLTEHAPQIAPREEHRPRSATAADGGLLPVMGGASGHVQSLGHPAYARLPRRAIHATGAGAKNAGGQISIGHRYRLSRFFLLYNTHEKIARFLLYFFVFFGLQTVCFVV